MKKIFSMFICFVLTVCLFTSCSNNEKGKNDDTSKDIVSTQEKAKIRVGTLKGPTAIGMLNLMEEDKNGTSKGDYDFEMFGAPDEIVTKFNKNELDIVAVPSNLASVLYNKTNGGVNVLNVNTLGVLYLVQNGDIIKSPSDLKGKTIYATGKGSTPQYVLEYLLKQNNLEIDKDVKVEYKAEHAELATLIAAGEVDIALLPQPFVTTAINKNKNIKIALDINKIWKESQKGNELVMGSIIARKEFVQKNPDVIKEFLNEYKVSAYKANQEIDKTASLCASYSVMDEAIAKLAIPKCAVTFISGQEMKTMVSEYLSVLLEIDPKSIGGKLPGEDFYFLG